ncbi:hypothetical protein Tco_0608708 [Tanacetum coccineum]
MNCVHHANLFPKKSFAGGIKGTSMLPHCERCNHLCVRHRPWLRGDATSDIHELDICLSTLHFLKLPKNKLESMMILENKLESLKLLEKKLVSMMILELSKLECLKAPGEPTKTTSSVEHSGVSRDEAIAAESSEDKPSKTDDRKGFSTVDGGVVWAPKAILGGKTRGMLHNPTGDHWESLGCCPCTSLLGAPNAAGAEEGGGRGKDWLLMETSATKGPKLFKRDAEANGSRLQHLTGVPTMRMRIWPVVRGGKQRGAHSWCWKGSDGQSFPDDLIQHVFTACSTVGVQREVAGAWDDEPGDDEDRAARRMCEVEDGY